MNLRIQVLERDGWKCQSCGRASNLHVHHIKYRSHLGHDAAENLLTLCADCHRASHQKHLET